MTARNMARERKLFMKSILPTSITQSIWNCCAWIGLPWPGLDHRLDRQRQWPCLRFGTRLGFQTNLARFQFDGIFHGAASVLLADLIRLLFDEGGEGIETGGVSQLLARVLFGFHQRLIERLYVLAVFLYVG